MNLLELPGTQIAYPNNESNCHGAPVYKLDKRIGQKYICTECGEWCIPRQKK